MKSLFTGKTYQVKILGVIKGTLKAENEISALRRASLIYNNGNTRCVSVAETK